MANTQKSYWAGSRVGRRSVLRGVGFGAAGLAGAALIGCSAGSKTAPAPTVKAATDNAKPRRGGTVRTVFSFDQDPDSFDWLLGLNPKSSYPAQAVYSRLMKYDIGNNSAAPGTVSGDLVEKWEQPDPLTVILHLRQNAMWDRRAPTNGRKVVADDVVKSFEKFAAKSGYRASLANSVNKDAPLVKFEAVDDKTLKAKLAFPDALFLTALAAPLSFAVMPMESMNGGFDPNADMRGSGPFIMTEFTPSVGMKYKRNPDWHFGPDRPYIDNMEHRIMGAPAQMEAQFRAGNLEYLGAGNTQLRTQLPIIAKAMKDAQIVKQAPPATGQVLGFSFNADQPWKDVRLRRAISMCIDRSTLRDVTSAPKDYEDIGVKMGSYWNTPINAGFGKSWLDPQGKDFGPAAQYMQYNVAEAKKLLSAAGYTDQKPLSFEYQHSDPHYKTQDMVETVQSMLTKAGMQVKLYNADYSTWWVPKNLRGKGKFKSSTGTGNVVSTNSNSNQGDPVLWAYTWQLSTGSMTTAGTEFPALDDIIRKARGIFDFEARKEIVHEMQRFMVDNMVQVPTGAEVDIPNISRKNLHGPEQYKSYLNAAPIAEEYPYYWMDA